MKIFATIKVIPLCLTLAIFFSLCVGLAYSADPADLKPRVPADKLPEVTKLKNLVSANEEALEASKKIFLGKGICFTCHGTAGKGDGAAAASFNPRPRNFTDADWQKARTDGEIFWAITNGTEFGMNAFEDMLPAEQRWMLVAYIRSLGKPAGRQEEIEQK